MATDSATDLTRKIDAICKEFEQAWNSSQHPRIEEYRTRIGWPANVGLFKRLVQLEARLRCGSGESVRWSDYRDRFPSEIELIDEIQIGQETQVSDPTRSETPGENGGESAQAIEIGRRRTSLGDYELLSRIGRGGMGVVYKARDTKLGKNVAVKVLPLDSMFSESARVRFQNEAKAAAQLEHPHVVPVYAFGIEDGTYYYAMQYIEGENLAHWISKLRESSHGLSGDVNSHANSTVKERSDATQRESGESIDLMNAISSGGYTSNRSYLRAFVRIGVQIAEALQHAHDLGIVHRDIKPANLLLDAHGDVYVADFGLAQVQGNVELTLPGYMVGTLRYMSPEQAYAKRIVVDHRADVFSLGATLYELLTLRHAFDGSTRTEILRQVAFEDPPPPRRINRRIPDDLNTIVMKCLAKNPDERYQSAAELAADLRFWEQDDPIRARKPTPLQRAAKWTRKHRALVQSLSVVSAVIIIAFISSVVYAFQAEQKSRKRVEGKNAQLAAALKESEGRRLVALASLELSRNPGLSVSLARAGAKLHPGREANTALLAALDENHEQFVVPNDAPVGIARFSPDGTEIVTTGTPEFFRSDPVPARIFDGETGELRLELKNEATITSAAFERTGKRLLTSSNSTSALGQTAAELAKHPPAVWDVARGVKIGELKDAFLIRAEPRSFRPIGDVTLIVAPARENTARIYNAVGDAVRAFEGHTGRVSRAAYSPDGMLIVTVSDDRTVCIWDAQNADLRRRLDHWESRLPDEKAGRLVADARFSPDSKQLLTISKQLGIDLWDIEKGEPRSCGRGQDATFSPDGEQIAISRAGTVRVLDTHSLTTLYELEHQRDVAGLKFSPDSKRIVTWTPSIVFHVWDAESGERLSEFRGHELSVNFAAFSPDSQRLVSASRDRTARVWHLESGEERAHFATPIQSHYSILSQSRDGNRCLFSTEAEHSSSVWNLDADAPRLTVSGRMALPAANRFVTAEDHLITVYDSASGEKLASFQRRLGRFLTAKMDPSGKHVLVVSRGGPSFLWSWESGEAFRITDHRAALLVADFHPTKPIVSGGQEDGVVRTWSIETGKPVGRFTCGGSISDLRYSAEGDRLLVINSENHGYVLDAENLDVVTEIASNGHRFNSGRFADGSNKVVTFRSISKNFCCWDATSGQLVSQVDSPAGRLTVTLNRAGTKAVVTSDQAGLFVWDIVEGEIERRSARRYFAATFLGDGQQIVASTAHPISTTLRLSTQSDRFDRPRLEIWNPEDEEPSRQINLDHGAIRWMRVDAQTGELVVRVRSLGLAIFDSENRQRLGTIKAHAAPISFAQFTPDGKRIVSASWDTQVMIWDAETFKLIRILDGHQSPIMAAALSTDGKLLGTAGRDGKVLLWNLEQDQMQPLRQLDGLSESVTQCSFSAFAARLAACTTDGTWRIWDTNSGQEVAMDMYDQKMFAVEFQPDGSKLLLVPRPGRDAREYPAQIVSADDRVAQLMHEGTPKMFRFGSRGQRIVGVSGSVAVVWNASTGERQFTLRHPGSSISFAAFGPEGQRMLTHQGMSISLWDADGNETLTIANDFGFRTASDFDHVGLRKAYVITPEYRVRTLPFDPEMEAQHARPLSKDEQIRYRTQLSDEQASEAP